MAEMIFMVGGCWGRKTEKESPIVGLRSCNIITVAHAGPPRRCLAAGRGPALCTDVSPQPHCTMYELAFPHASFSCSLLSYCLFCPFCTSHSGGSIIRNVSAGLSETFTSPANMFTGPTTTINLINMIKHTHNMLGFHDYGDFSKTFFLYIQTEYSVPQQ